VDSLVKLILASLNRPGAYIASDQMTSLDDISKALRKQTRSYTPVIMPLPVVKFGVLVMEAIARVVPIKPLTSSVQVAFLTRGWRPDSTKAVRELSWTPMSLDEGCRRYLSKSGVRQQVHEQALPHLAAG